MISAGWTEQYEEQRNDRKLLAELDRKAKRGDLQAEEALDYAYLTEQFEGLEKANPLYTAALKLNPDYGPANLHMGRILLEQDNEAGLSHLI